MASAICRLLASLVTCGPAPDGVVWWPERAAPRLAASAYLTFVAIGKDGKPRPVPAVAPETERQQRRHEEAQQRREYRINSRIPKPA